MTLSSSTPILFSLLTLTFLEIVLGVDNLVFLSIISAKLPLHQRKLARRLGLIFALITRLLLLGSVVWLVHIKQPLFTLGGIGFSIRDILLFAGGLFLLVKATQEIHREIEPTESHTTAKFHSLFFVIAQIGILDIIFSLDSVFTAVGLTDQFYIMAIAICIAILTMIFLSEPLSKLINDHPTIKILALSFLLLIGVILIADAFHHHIPREYVYFSIFFSIFVELLNSFVRSRAKAKRKTKH